MRAFRFFLALSGLLFVLPAQAALPDHAKGSASAPITVIEYSSITCSHCAHFYNDVLPEIEKRYINTGKVRFIYREFPVDSVALKGAALAYCLPADKFYPFVAVLYKNRDAWLSSPKPEDVMTQYAKLAGLSDEKAKSCLEDTKLLDDLVALRTDAMSKYNIEATPTFIINDGEEKIVGARRLEAFTSAFDKLLAKKKK